MDEHPGELGAIATHWFNVMRRCGGDVREILHDGQLISQALGLKRAEVVVVPYDPRWPLVFEETSAQLRAALGPSILAVRHVGSTAVPGLCAKPILDVLVSVPHFDDAKRLVTQLALVGYEFRPEEEIPDRHYFRRPPGGELRTHHLSLAEPGSRHHRVTLALRDALRGNPEIAAAYARLKLALAQGFPFDRPAYIEGKSAFVRQVLATIGLHESWVSNRHDR